MTAPPAGERLPASPATSSGYSIRLKIPASAREDAWELCRLMVHCGGTEVSDCCFVFASVEQWREASEAVRFQFGMEWFEAAAPRGAHRD